MPIMHETGSRWPALRSITFAILVSLGAGCAHMLVPMEQLEPTFGEALDEHNYDFAAALLERLPDDYPAQEALRKRFQQASSAYAREVVSRATRQANQGRWVDAFATLDEGRARWEDSPEIAEATDQLKAREAALYRRLHAELLLAEANWLASRRQQTGELEQLHRRDARRLAVRWDRRASDVTARLQKLADRFIAAEDWSGARRLLLAASQVTGEDLSARMALVDEKVGRERSVPSSRPSGATRARAGELLSVYERSGDMADLVAARQHIFGHNSSGQLDTYAARLEELSRRRFQQGVIAGDQLYAAGHYREAKEIWEATLQLYPDDEELKKKLQRAEKVLKNLETLSRSQRP